MFWKKDKSYIKFHTRKELLDIIPHPVPANKAMPNWFKKLKPVIENNEKANAGTVKRCIPVLDAVSQGFIIPLWADLQVKILPIYNFKDEDGKIVHQEARDNPKDLINTITNVTKEEIKGYEDSGELGILCKFPQIDLGVGQLLSSHSWEQVGNACDLKKFKLGKALLKFTNPWNIKTAPGWSVKFQNPANNWENDIQLIEGVVDTDTYYNEVNFPYVWTGSTIGEYIIPRGTPLVHVIPFKREEVELEVGEINQKEKDKVFSKMHTKHFDRYKTFFWNKRKLEK